LWSGPKSYYIRFTDVKLNKMLVIIVVKA